MRCISTAMFATLVLVVVAGTARGQGSESLDKKQKTFETKKKDADKKMVQAFDKVVENIQRDKSLPVETRSRRIASVQAEKATFESANDLPESDVMLGATVEYLNLLQLLRADLQKAFEVALEKALGDKPEFDRISNEKAVWEAKLPGRDEFTSNSNWFGNRTFSNGTTVEFNVHVFGIENNSFKGHIWQDFRSVSGKSGWEFEGKIEGNKVMLTTTKMLHGSARRLDLQGYVIGKRLIFTAHVNGKPSKDFASTRKQ